MASSLTIALGGSASGGGGSSPDNATGSLGQDLASLIAQGSNAFSATGAGILNLDAGALSLASTAQVGRVVNGTVITKEIVQQNQSFLNAIGNYCRSHGILIDIEAQLTNSPETDWTYQWLGPAIKAKLPINVVYNDDEVEVFNAGTAVSKADRARYEVDIVKQIVKAFPNVKIGQWETNDPLDETKTWWDT